MKKYILFLFLSIPFLSGAQHTISGIVLDKDALIPLDGVHLYLKHAQKGTISNNQGEYQFTIDTTNITDTLCFSYLGYATVIKPLHNSSNLKDTIHLKPTSLLLAEMRVSANPLSAKEILEKAIENYDNNYLPINYKGTLKHAAYIENKLNRLLLSELVFVKKRKNVRLYKNKEKQYVKIKQEDNQFVGYVYLTNLMQLIHIKDQLIKYSKKLDLRDTSLDISVSPNYYGTNQVYEINLNKDMEKGQFRKIKLIIDKTSFALIELAFDVTLGTDYETKIVMIDSLSMEFPAMIPIFTGVIRFKPFEKKWMFFDLKAIAALEVIENKKITKKVKHVLLFTANQLNIKKPKKGLRLNLQGNIFKQIDSLTPASNFKEISLNKKELEFIKTKL